MRGFTIETIVAMAKTDFDVSESQESQLVWVHIISLMLAAHRWSIIEFQKGNLPVIIRTESQKSFLPGFYPGYQYRALCSRIFQRK